MERGEQEVRSHLSNQKESKHMKGEQQQQKEEEVLGLVFTS